MGEETPPHWKNFLLKFSSSMAGILHEIFYHTEAEFARKMFDSINIVQLY